MPHEIHADTPPEGRPLAELFNQFDIDNMTEVLRQRGAPYSISFGEIVLLANSRLSLQAAEFARDHDRYHAVHMALFKAYFTDGKNIGDMDVLKSVISECGLDPDAMATRLDNGYYLERVRQGSEAARQAGVTAIPTFAIQGQPNITGAVNEAIFREALQVATDALGIA